MLSGGLFYPYSTEGAAHGFTYSRAGCELGERLHKMGSLILIDQRFQNYIGTEIRIFNHPHPEEYRRNSG